MHTHKLTHSNQSWINPNVHHPAFIKTSMNEQYIKICDFFKAVITTGANRRDKRYIEKKHLQSQYKKKNHRFQLIHLVRNY